MSGGFVVDYAELRRVASRLEDAVDAIPGMVCGPAADAGRSTDEVVTAVAELQERLDALLESLKTFAPTLREVADDFARTDDDAAAHLWQSGRFQDRLDQRTGS